nr:type II toxin-antitoxin system RelE/ParE family toxin [Kineosporia babensis]
MIAPAARDEISAAPRPVALRILKTLLALERDPRGLSPTPPAPRPIPLASDPDRHTLRIGDHRVIYTVEDLKIIVWAVLPTGSVRN